MSFVIALAAVLSLAIWIYLLAARGGFWRLRERAGSAPNSTGPAPAVVAVIPARNEAPTIGDVVRSLFAQEYAGALHIVVADDDSADGTADAARRAAAERGSVSRLTIVAAKALPSGWTGKVWALSEGLRAASTLNAKYFLLTDADIVHGPHALAEMVTRAEAGELDLVSRMARLSCASPAERALIPAFVFFFFMLYPPAWVARRDRRTAAAAGGCMLVRARALARIDGMEAIRGEIIDDCALARAIKPAGALWLGLADDTRSLRAYGSWGEIEAMIARTAYTQLRHSPLLLAGTLLAMAVTFLAPPVLLAAGGWPAVCGAAAWLAMSICYAPTLRFYGCSAWRAVTLPLIGAFYMAATLHSAAQHWQGRGAQWRGRVQGAR